MIKNFGFISMRFEKKEVRDFRPSFFKNLRNLTQKIYLDYGYGEKLGFHEKDYVSANPNIIFRNRFEVFKKDCVITIRTPDFDELLFLNQNAVFMSMLHYSTRKKRNEFLLKKKINLISMDSITDDSGKRLIQNYEGTVENAFNVAYGEIFNYIKDKEFVRVLVIGSGEIGKIAVDKAIKLSLKPVIVETIGKNITSNINIVNHILQKTDILVDASKREDSTKYIIKNESIKYLPEEAIILDISADDYDVNIDPIQVKGIEGIPTGTIDKYVFNINSDEYDRIPRDVYSSNRRKVISCNAWPAVNPHNCLTVYENQILPFINTLSECDFNKLDLVSKDYYIRALARGKYEYWEKVKNNNITRT